MLRCGFRHVPAGQSIARSSHLTLHSCNVFGLCLLPVSFASEVDRYEQSCVIRQPHRGLLQKKAQIRKMPGLLMVVRMPFWSILCRAKAGRPRADHGRNIETNPEYRQCLFPTTVPAAV